MKVVKIHKNRSVNIRTITSEIRDKEYAAVLERAIKIAQQHRPAMEQRVVKIRESNTDEHGLLVGSKK